jgi:phosphoribosylformylglycinamidine cyclo-ligase
MYAAGHYDLAGFAVGAAERTDLLPDTASMKAGDTLIGLASSGPHSNGYSLVRRIVERSGLDLSDPAPFDAYSTLGSALLTPTRIYVKSLLPLIRARRIKGLAHITGGGLTDNAPRMCPAHLVPRFDPDAWPLPPVFEWLRETGAVADEEMQRTFNCGIGMVLAADPAQADQLLLDLKAAGESARKIGELAPA